MTDNEPDESAPFGTQTEIEVPERTGLSWRWWARAVVGAALAVGLLAWGLPKVTGASWQATSQALTYVGLGQGLVMFALLLVAMWCYTFVLSASLPGLTHRKAWIVNVSGSSVSNLVPFGGAAGVGVTYMMCRSWGFSRTAIALSTAMSGLWNVMAKLAMPAIGLAALVLGGGLVAHRLAVAAGVGACLLVVVILVVITVLVSERAALVVGRAAARAGEVVLWVMRSHRRLHWDDAIVQTRRRTTALVRRSWVGMTFGMAGFLAVYAVLFLTCLYSVGAHPTLPQALAAYTLGRLLTSVVITPGGLGIAEAGSGALLVALGVPAAPAAAGVLLFAFYVHILEVPLGALGWLGWTLMRRSVPV